MFKHQIYKSFWAWALLLLLAAGCAPQTITVKTFPTTKLAVKEVHKGMADAVVGDYPVIAYEARESAGRLEVSSQQFETTALGIGLAKEATLLKAAITDALRKMSEDETYLDILATWAVGAGKVEPPEAPDVVPVAGEVPELQDGVLKVGTELSYPPMEFRDEFNKEAGVDVELARAIGKVLGVEVEFIDMPFDALIDSVETQKVDVVLSAMGITDERSTRIDFIPYVEMGSGILVEKGNPKKIRRLSDLCGFTVAVQEATSQLDIINSQQCE